MSRSSSRGTSSVRRFLARRDKKQWKRRILVGTIVPGAIITASAVDIFWTGGPQTLNVNPVYGEGLKEGKLAGTAMSFDPNPVNGPDQGLGAGISLSVRMAQDRTNPDDGGSPQPPGGSDPDSFWKNNRTWVYTGEVNTGALGKLSFAENVDDVSWLKINDVVVLNNNAWNVPTETGVLNFAPNTWVSFEARFSNGGGGAGPSAQGSGWDNTTGFIMSQTGTTGVDPTAAGYFKPVESQNGTPELFRYLISAGAGGDDIHIKGDTTLTLQGLAPVVTERTINFEPGTAGNPVNVNLTINSADSSVKTLTTTNGVSLAPFGDGTDDNSTVTVTTNANTIFKPGALVDRGALNVQLIKAGVGEMVLDAVSGSQLGSTTIKVTDGRLSVIGNGTNPLATLGNAIQLSSDTAKLRVGSTDGTSTTFVNGVRVTANATIEHASNTVDTLGSSSKSITVSAGKTLTADVSNGFLTLAGGINPGGANGALTKIGAGTLNVTAPTNLNALTVNGGRVEFTAPLTSTTSPTLTSGTLALRTTGNTIPGPFTVGAGATLEGVPGALGTASTAVNLTGGTLALAGQGDGLNGFYYNLAPQNANNVNPDFASRAAYTSFFAAQTPTVGPVLTTVGGVKELSFNAPAQNAQMYSMYGFLNSDNIISRMTGVISVPVSGVYTFGTTSDDGSMLFVDGQTVANNNNFQGMTRRSGSLFLSAGLHDIDIGYYEGGGGNGLIVDWAGPGFTTKTLSNDALFSSANVTATFTNPINVQSDSAINALAPRVVADNITIANGKKLSTSGREITATNLTLSGSATLDVDNTFITPNILDGGAAVNVTKTGAGVWLLNNTDTPQFQNGGTISVQQGALGLLLGGTLSGTGNATIAFNGGGVVLSSKTAVDRTYAIPNFTGNAIFEARQLPGGVAGTPETPLNLTLTGNLNIGAANTVRLGTADNYVLHVGGTGSGGGTVKISGGVVVSDNNTALNGFALNFAPPGGGAGQVVIKGNTPTFAGLNSTGAGTQSLVVGTGTGPTTVTVNGTGNGVFTGAITPAAGNTDVSLVKSGSGSLSMLGANNFAAVSVTGGTLEIGNAVALGSATVTLNGGTLQFADAGLLGQYYNTDAGAQAAFGTYSGYTSFFAGKGAPSASMPTGRAVANSTAPTELSFSPDGGDNLMFSMYGYSQNNNILSRMSGRIYIPQDGVYTFGTTSDDGSILYLDGQKLVDNNNYQGMTRKDGTIQLTAGYHDIDIGFYEGGGGNGLIVDWTGPGFIQQNLPNSVLSTTQDVHAANNVKITGTGGRFDLRGGNVTVPFATWSHDATVTVDSGTLSFVSGAELDAAGTYTVAGSGTFIPGVLDGSGAIVIEKTGTGTLVLNNTESPQLGGAGSAINVRGGQLSVVLDGFSTNSPVGSASVNLAGGNLALGSKGGSATFGAPLTLSSDATITAGKVTADSAGVGGESVNITSAVNFGSKNLTLRSNNGYMLAVSGNLTGTGNLAVNSGTVSASGNVSAGAVAVTGGATFGSSTSLTASALNVNNGRAEVSGAVNLSGGATVGSNSVLSMGATNYTGGAIALNGGALEATGVTNLANATITVATRTETATSNALDGRLYLQTGIGIDNDGGAANLLRLTPANSASLTGALSFGGDAAFRTFFGGTNPIGDAQFTAAYTGRISAPTTGQYTLGISQNDDRAVFWVDLNQNGVFETSGSAGSELISNAGCCGGNTNVSVNLVAGQSYNVLIAVEDTGGGSGLEAHGALPAGGGATIQPGTQPGLWSSVSASGGGDIRVAGGGDLTVNSITGLTTLNFTGNGAAFRLNSGSTPTVSTIDSVITSGFNTSTLELGANNTLNAAHFTLAENSTLIKTGAGAVIAAAQGLGAGSTLQVDAGTVILNGAAAALNPTQATAGSGSAVVNGGTLLVNGSISGQVTVNGGLFGGAGSIGALTVHTGGLLSPGNNAPGILTVNGNFSIDAGSAVSFQLGTTVDQLVVNGGISLSGASALFTMLPSFQANTGQLFFLAVNDDIDPILNVDNLPGSFAGLPDGGTFSVNGGQFKISYFGDSATSAFTGGNDIVIQALAPIPEPSSVVTLLGGLTSLVGLQRFRRRKA